MYNEEIMEERSFIKELESNINIEISDSIPKINPKPILITEDELKLLAFEPSMKSKMFMSGIPVYLIVP